MREEEEFNILEEKIRNTPLQQINYSFRVTEDLYNRFNKHIQLLKRLESASISKQRWITESIREKLELEKKGGIERTAKDRHIGFRVEKLLSRNIEKSVEKIRKFRRSFSKTLWFVEAISEKLEREEKKTKEKLRLLAKSIESEQKS